MGREGKSVEGEVGSSGGFTCQPDVMTIPDNKHIIKATNEVNSYGKNNDGQIGGASVVHVDLEKSSDGTGIVALSLLGKRMGEIVGGGLGQGIGSGSLKNPNFVCQSHRLLLSQIHLLPSQGLSLVSTEPTPTHSPPIAPLHSSTPESALQPMHSHLLQWQQALDAERPRHCVYLLLKAPPLYRLVAQIRSPRQVKRHRFIVDRTWFREARFGVLCQGSLHETANRRLVLIFYKMSFCKNE
ncbi:hypothetical protein Q3G72_028408 [Acer saccharum]|nr:hypothetical protein Q3G72_028408 [Acer saccharum]